MDKPLWGLKVLKFDGAIAPRVLKFDAPPARGFMIKPNNRASLVGKQADLAPQARLYGFPLQNAYHAI